jgi:hypothetical protein
MNDVSPCKMPNHHLRRRPNNAAQVARISTAAWLVGKTLKKRYNKIRKSIIK